MKEKFHNDILALHFEKGLANFLLFRCRFFCFDQIEMPLKHFAYAVK